MKKTADMRGTIRSKRNLEERIQRLEHAVNRHIAEADSAATALKATIRDLCEAEAWECGRYFRWDAVSGLLRFSGAWCVPIAAAEQFIENSRDLTYAPGVGLAGRVWQSGQALWVPDVTQDPRVAQFGLALKSDIHGAFIFPIVADGSAIGVLSFSSREVREPDERMLQAVRVIGSQIGQFLRRKEAEDALRGSEERFRRLTLLSSDIYWEQDDQYRFMSFSETGPEWIKKRAIGKKRWELNYLNMRADDWAAHMSLLEARRPFRDLELCRLDQSGRRSWVSASGEAVFDASGAFQGYRGVGRDITARKRAEQLLALEHVVNLSIAGAESESIAVRAAIRAICEKESWECGRYWRVDEKAGVLRFGEAWSVPGSKFDEFLEQWRAVVYRPGEGLAGKAWQSGEPQWAADITQDARLEQKLLALRSGMRGVFAFPVISGGNPIGVLVFNSREVRERQEELVQAIRAIGSQMGQFLKRKQAEEAVRELMLNVARGVSATTGEPFFHSLVRHLSSALGADFAFVGELDPEDPGSVRTVAAQADGVPVENFRYKLHGSPCETVVGQRVCVYPSEVYKSFPEDTPLAQKHIEAYVGAPLTGASGQPLGLIVVMFRSPLRETALAQSLLQIFAARAASELERVHHVTALEHQAQQQRLVAELGQQALASTDLAKVLNRAVELVSTMLKAEYCNVLELDSEGKLLMFKAAVGWPAEWVGRRTVPLGPGGYAEYALSHGEPLVIEDHRRDTRFVDSPLLSEFGIRSSMRAPIGTQGAFGILAVHTALLRRFTEDEVNFLRNIANTLAVAIERKKSEEQLAYLAQFDSLTGLPNRHLFQDRLAQSMAQAKRSGQPMAVLFIDLDRFKRVNDTLGHSAGDKLLKEAAERVEQCVRSGDTVGRFGGDEFGVILTDLSATGDAGLVGQKVIGALERPFNLEGTETYVSASIGITVFPADGDEAGGLIMNADAAMYRAKEQGRNNYQYFTREMNERATQRAQMEAALRRAIERKEFLLYYQPKVDLESGDICGLEALLRWQHPDKGIVLPREIIPVLEDTGLIVPVGEWVMREVCRQAQAWRKAGIAVPPIAINLSARQFQQKELEATVRGILSETGVDPSLIQFELTESLLMEEPDAAALTLRGLKESGVKISVDDFGTGYSSLAYLKRFPIDALKIDRAFIRDITTDPEDAAIALAIIGLAHSLKLKVIAEGVETEGQLNFLSTHACDEMQGYYFARPIAPAEIEAKLREGWRLQLSEGSVPDKPAVLLLDDSEQDLLLLEGILRSDGFPVLTTTDPKRAFELLAGHPISVVISDNGMPGLTGVEFLGHVRKLYPEVVRILATGAHDPEAIAGAVNEAGIHKFLSKDWDSARLRAEVREVHRRHFPTAGAEFPRFASQLAEG